MILTKVYYKTVYKFYMTVLTKTTKNIIQFTILTIILTHLVKTVTIIFTIKMSQIIIIITQEIKVIMEI